MTEQTYGIPPRKDLPKRLDPMGPETHAVHITYKRVIGASLKTNFQTKVTEFGPDYGGAIATYPRELGFHLDVKSLLPEVGV